MTRGAWTPLSAWAPAAGAARRAVSAHPDAAALALVLAVAVAIRVAFSPLVPVFLHGDSYQYYRPAAGLITGEGFPLPLKRPPLYPVFMALVGWSLDEDLRALALVQHLLGVGTAALTFGVGRLAAGRGAGLVGGLAAALSGGLLIYERYVLTEALFAFLLTLGVLLFLVGLRRGGIWWWVGSGLAVGLATLTRVHAQVLLLLAPVAMALVYRRWCPPVRGTLVACVAAACVLVPWMARNQVVHGDFTVAARSGQSLIYQTLVHHPGKFVFYDPANPPQDSDPKMERARKFIQQRNEEKTRNPSANVLGITIHAWLMRNLDLTEAQANRIMRDVALDAIRARPLTYAGVVLEEIGHVFFGTPERLSAHLTAHRRLLADGDNPPPRRLRAMIEPVTGQEPPPALAERLVQIYQSSALGPLVPSLAAVGLLAAMLVPGWRLALVPGLTVVALHGVGAAVVGFSERYRQPPDPLLHVVAFVGVLFLLRLAVPLLARARRPAAPTAAPSTEAPAPS